MARTNIEDSACTRALELAHALQWEPAKALGAITWLWHESQDKYRSGGSGKEIYRWSKLAPGVDPASYLEALVEIELIRPAYEGPLTAEMEFEILGNDIEIASLVSLKSKSKKGGEATRAKWDKERQRVSNMATGRPTPNQAMPVATPDARPQAMPEDPPGLAPGVPQLGTIQCSTMQFNSNQSNASPLKPPLADSVKRCAAVWQKTLEHFKQSRPLIPGEDMKIARSIQRWDAPSVELALIGIRHEAKSADPGGFDPAQHVHLTRILSPEKFERFVGLGATAVEKQRTKLAQMKPAEREKAETSGGVEVSQSLTPEQIQAAIRAEFPSHKPVKIVKEPETPEEISAAAAASLAEASS